MLESSFFVFFSSSCKLAKKIFCKNVIIFPTFPDAKLTENIIRIFYKKAKLPYDCNIPKVAWEIGKNFSLILVKTLFRSCLIFLRIRRRCVGVPWHRPGRPSRLAETFARLKRKYRFVTTLMQQKGIFDKKELCTRCENRFITTLVKIFVKW
jgi:hypothetical protein